MKFIFIFCKFYIDIIQDNGMIKLRTKEMCITIKGERHLWKTKSTSDL